MTRTPSGCENQTEDKCVTSMCLVFHSPMKGRPRTSQPNRSLEVREVLTGEFSGLCLKLSREARKNSHLHIARWSLEKLDHFTKNMQQVCWPLAQFFLFHVCKKSCPPGKSRTPSWGNANLFRSSQQLPRLRVSDT